MRRSLVYLIVICPALIVLASLQASALSSYRYDPANTGYVAQSIPLPLTLLWKHSTELTEDPIIASPTVGDDAVYFCIQQKVFALDRLTGDVKWEFSTGAKLFGSLLLHDDRLYFGAQDSNLWVLNASTGQPEWKFKLGGPVDCPPLIVGNMLYIGSDDDSLHAIDVTRQGQVWAFGTRDDIKAAPAFSRGRIFIASRDEHIYCLDSNGQQRWRAKLKSENNFSAPIVDSDKELVFVASDTSLHCFDAASGQSRWAPFAAGDLIVGTPALAPDRKLYVGSKDGAVYCISTLDGRAIWKYPKGAGTSIEPIMSSPTILDDDTLLVRTGPKLLAALNRQTGDVKWQYRLETPPEKKKTDAKPGAGGLGGGMMGMPGMPGGESGMMGMPGMPGAGAGAGGGEDGAMAPGAGSGRRSTRGGRGTRGGRDGLGGRGGRSGRSGRSGRGGRGGRGGLGGAGALGGLGGLGGGATEEEEPAEFDENLRSSLIVAEGGIYVLGDCGALYAFDAEATDETPPAITEAVLDITGKDKYRFLYGLAVLGADEPANRDAEALAVPGLPPIRLTFKVLDEGSGINPGSVELTMSGNKIEALYDPVGSQVMFILDPEHGPAKPLPNGQLNFVLKLRDWHGHQAVGQVSFTVDNALPPLEHKTGAAAGGMMGMPGMPGGEAGMMGMPGMPNQ